VKALPGRLWLKCIKARASATSSACRWRHSLYLASGTKHQPSRQTGRTTPKRNRRGKPASNTTSHRLPAPLSPAAALPQSAPCGSPMVCNPARPLSCANEAAPRTIDGGRPILRVPLLSPVPGAPASSFRCALLRWTIIPHTHS
jgi:hypothetical protein